MELNKAQKNRLDKIADKYGLRRDYYEALSKDQKMFIFFERTMEAEEKRKELFRKTLVGHIINKTVDIKKVPPRELVRKVKEELSSKVVDNQQIKEWVSMAIAALPKAVEEYKEGKGKAIGPLMGFVMAKSKGKADPLLVKNILNKKLKGEKL